jgi:osmoprotectant transport system ATP-binding protein
MAPETGPDQISAPAIRFDHVSKRFAAAGQAAVNDVSLAVPSGDLVVLLGPSGCGKTTLLKMVNRLVPHDSGTIQVEGRDIQSVPVTALRRGIGYVIQSTGLFPHLSVAQNVATVPDLLGWDRARIAARVDELLDLVGLPPAEYRRRYPAQLSGGQQQRVGLARALAADPAILLMDEPFAAIDNITRRRLQDELRDIQARVRKTILFVTHDVDEALRLADRIAVMRQGQVLQYDTPLAILSTPADAFVAELVGASDVFRRLGLLPVTAAMTPGTGTANGVAPTIPATENVRDALSLLLTGQADHLVVLDEQGQSVGTLDLPAIRRALEAGHGSV